MNDCMCKYVCALVSLENYDSKSCNLVINVSTLFQSYVEHCMNVDCWHKLSPLYLTENSFLTFFTSFREQYSLWSSCYAFQLYHPEDADTESINSTVIYAISVNIYMKYIYFRNTNFIQMAICGLRTWHEFLVFLFPSHFLFLFPRSTVSGLENCACLSSLSATGNYSCNHPKQIFFSQKLYHSGLIDQLCLSFKPLSSWLGSSLAMSSVSHLDVYFSELMTYIKSQIGYLYFMFVFFFFMKQ